ncbi:probable inactive purple acid phosphatase 28 isoform X2 [Cryptomeria japonica]|nr:probable inactive purple acid phosphatase 28 isoform X2 [Cryptomeria japonica]
MHYANGAVTSCEDVFPSQFHSCSDLNTSAFLNRMIQYEKPDFIVFTGDNIYGPDSADAADSMDAAFAPAVKSKIAWAAVLGNHDQESTMTREELMSYISVMDYSISQVNPLWNNHNTSQRQRFGQINGFGNYNIEVKGAFGSEFENVSIFNLYFLDSGDRSVVPGIPGYGWIKESQLTWLQDVSAVLQDANRVGPETQSNLAPALAFFHIPLPEVRHFRASGIVGEKQEQVGCASVNSGVLNTFIHSGDVKAAFVGHDHVNDFCGKTEGIWLCYGGGFGYHAYGKAGWSRRARVIMANLEKGQKMWQGVTDIRTWKRLDDEELTKINEQLLWSKQ